MLLRKRKLNLFTSLDTLKILTFWKILKDRNVLLLDFDYKDGKHYTEQEKVEIAILWERLYDEYYILRDSVQSKNKVDSGFKELRLKDKINNLALNHDFLVSLSRYSQFLSKKQAYALEQKCYEVVKKVEKRIKLQLFEGIERNAEIIKKAINSLQNTYNIHYAKQDQKVDNEIKNVYEVVANMEGWLGKDNINIEDMVCSKWIAYEKIRDDKIKKNRDVK